MTETSMGGSHDAFPETAWSSILRDPAGVQSRDRLEKLFSLYWRPVYCFVREGGRRTVEDSKDLTQSFFEHVLEKSLVGRYDRERGRFRDFLKGSLRNFLAQEWRDSRREKRGGGRMSFSLDVEELETAEFLADLRQRTPEEIFDRQWMDELLNRSLVLLKETLEKDGKGVYFQAYELYEMPEPGAEAPTYESVAAALGLKPKDVGNHLVAVKKMLHNLLMENISEYVVSREQLIEEMKDLFLK